MTYPASSPFARRTRFVLVACAATLALSACTRTNPFAAAPQSNNSVTALTPAPSGNVARAPLQPANPAVSTPPVQPGTAGAPLQPAAAPITNQAISPAPEPAPAPVQVAKATPADGGKPVTRETLLGAWTVSSGGANCQIFLTLTKWSGGYRAASRACPAPIKSVQAWDVKGKQVVLVDGTGGTAATLFRSADSRFDGTTTSGKAISFSR